METSLEKVCHSLLASRRGAWGVGGGGGGEEMKVRGREEDNFVWFRRAFSLFVPNPRELSPWIPG